MSLWIFIFINPKLFSLRNRFIDFKFFYIIIFACNYFDFHSLWNLIFDSVIQNLLVTHDLQIFVREAKNILIIFQLSIRLLAPIMNLNISSTLNNHLWLENFRHFQTKMLEKWLWLNIVLSDILSKWHCLLLLLNQLMIQDKRQVL